MKTICFLCVNKNHANKSYNNQHLKTELKNYNAIKVLGILKASLLNRPLYTQIHTHEKISINSPRLDMTESEEKLSL